VLGKTQRRSRKDFQEIFSDATAFSLDGGTKGWKEMLAMLKYSKSHAKAQSHTVFSLRLCVFA
jgi:hypothetical protein